MLTLHKAFEASLQGSFAFERIDQPTGAGIMRRRLLLVVELCQDFLGERLAQFDTPLVKAVDVPDGALRESKMLVVDDQCTQSCRRDLVSQNRGRRTVAEEGFMRYKLILRPLCLDLFRSLADHQGLRLGEKVGSKHPALVRNCSFLWKLNLLLVLVVFYRIVALSSKNKVSGNELGSLVEQLVERVLCVGCWLAKEDRTSCILDVITVAGDGLAVRLHRELLKISWEPVQILVKARSSQHTISKKRDLLPYGETR